MFIQALLVILALFVIFLILKSWIGIETCILCIASTVTWLLLLGLYHEGVFESFLVISILAGATVHGLFTEITARLKKSQLLFRIPVLFTLIFITYSLLSWTILLNNLLFILGIWVVFLLIYYSSREEKLKTTVNALIKCCRDF